MMGFIKNKYLLLLPFLLFVYFFVFVGPISAHDSYVLEFPHVEVCTPPHTSETSTNGAVWCLHPGESIPTPTTTPTPSPSGGSGADVGTIGIPIPFDNLGEIISGLLNVAYVAAGAFFLIQVVIGGIQWINAGGDPKAMESARGRITNAVIGLVIVVAAFAITIIVTTLLGVNIFSGEIINIIPGSGS